MASGVKVGQLVIDMAADVAHLKTDMAAASTAVGDAMQKVQASVELAKSAFIALTGVASVKALEGIVLGAIDGAAKLHELSIQAGISVEALSGLAAVGKATGTGADTIAAASNKLSKALATSTEDSKGAAAALKALGLSFDDFQKMSPDERMKQVADAMDGFADGGQKSAAAMLLFGKTGAEMLPMLKDLADAGELHAKVTSEQAEQAHEFEVALAKLQLQGQAWKKSLAMELLPTLDDVVKTMLDMSASSKDLGSEAGKGLTVFLQTAAVLGVNTFYVLKQIGIEIGGMAAQMVAVAHIDFSGAAAIGVAMKEDAAAARVEVDKLSASLLAAHTAQTTQNGYNARQGFGEKSQITGLEGNAGGPSATAAIDAQANAYKSLIASMREKIAIDDLEAAGGQKLTQAQQLGLDIEKMATEGKITSAMAGSALVKTLLDEVDASEKKKTAALAINKVISDALKYQADQNKLDAQHILAMRDYVQAQQDSSDALTFEIGLMGQSADVRAAAIAQYQVELDLKKKIAAIDADPYYQNNQVARDAAVAQAQTVSAQKAADAVKRVTLDTWNSTYDQVSSDLADALLKAGQDGGASLRSYLETELLSKPFKLIVQALIQPVATSMTNLITGGSTGGGILNSISNASTLSNMGMGYGIGNAAGTMVANATGTGIDGLLATNGAYGTAGGAMGALGTAMPYIGAAVLAYSLLSGNNTKSTSATGSGQGTYDASGNLISLGGHPAGVNNSTADGLVATLESSYQATAKALGITTAQAIFGYGSNTGKQGENPQLIVTGSAGGSSFNSGEVAVSDANLQLASSRAVLAALQGSTLPKYLSGVFDGITASSATQDQITSALTAAEALGTFHAQLMAMPTAFQKLADTSYATMQNIAALSGGMDKLQANLGSYYTNFYTADEQRAQLIANTEKSFKSLGLVMPTLDDGARAAYRSLVEQAGAQDLSVEANAKAYAGLLDLNGAMNTLAPAFTTAADAAKTAADAFAKMQASVKSATDVAIQLGLTTSYQEAQKTALAEWTSALAKLPALVGYTEKQIVAYAADPNNRSQLDATAWATIDKLVSAIGAWDTAKKTEAGNTALTSAATVSGTGGNGEAIAAYNTQITSNYTYAIAQIAQDTQAFVDKLSAVAQTPFETALSNLAKTVADKKAQLDDLAAPLTEKLRAEMRSKAQEDYLWASLSGSTDEAYKAFYDAMNAANTATIDTTGALTAWTAAQTNALYATEQDTLAGKYKAAMTSEQANAAITGAGFNIAGLDQEGIKAYFYNLLSGANATTAAGQKIIASVSGITSEIDLLVSASSTLAAASTKAMDSMKSLSTAIGSIAYSQQGIRSQMAGYDAVAYTTSQVAKYQAQFSSATDTAGRVAYGTSLQGAIVSKYDAELALINKNKEAASAAAQSVFDAQTTATNNAISAQNALNATYRQIGDYAKGLLTGALSPFSGKDQLTAASASYAQLLAGSTAGDKDALGKLTGAANTYLESAKLQAVSSVDYARVFDTTMNDLSGFGAKAGTDMETVQRQFMFDSTAYDKQALDLQTSTVADLQTLSDSLKDSLSEQALAYVASGPTNAQIADNTAAIGPGFEMVTNAINSAQDARIAQAALLAEIQALRVEVSGLRKSSEATAANTGATAAVLDSATGGGGPMLVQTA